MPSPDVPVAPPIPGVSRPERPPDKFQELAELYGQRRGDDAVTAMEKIARAISELREAAQMEPRIADMVQQAIALLTGGPGQPPMQPGGIGGPLSATLGMGGPPPLPPGIG